jgi:hypothetical protein
MKAIIATAALGAALVLSTAAPAPAADTMKGGAMKMASCSGVTISAVGGSGESGCASVRGGNGVIFLAIQVKGEPAGADQPSHIHKGKCGSNGPIVIPLMDVVGGGSANSIKYAKWTTVSQGGYYINVHKSKADLKTIVACGNIAMKTM